MARVGMPGRGLARLQDLTPRHVVAASREVLIGHRSPNHTRRALGCATSARSPALRLPQRAVSTGPKSGANTSGSGSSQRSPPGGGPTACECVATSTLAVRNKREKRGGSSGLHPAFHSEVCSQERLRCWVPAAARPTRPVPSKARVPGSGTLIGVAKVMTTRRLPPRNLNS